ncbi:hypothetical protein GCHA_1304 [Paraglaciecola chathamensis S18K6]|uniref:Transposase n=2 Tax=Paraglaciecola chathamensis TaxID=368405 RepID=A0ABQ0IDB7_9ALTE|nr:hypothetical protein GAGA_4561 [Paraglaciecola agarilytica NO2]GAC09265.1 hypothetical protein GCHA_1304 [Paraglaciecola chathamensis S18K6]
MGLALSYFTELTWRPSNFAELMLSIFTIKRQRDAYGMKRIMCALQK